MPVPFANELSDTAGESQDDLLEVSVFVLADFKTIPEQTGLNVLAGGPWAGKLVRGPRDLPHTSEHKDPARFASPVVREQIPLSGNAS